MIFQKHVKDLVLNPKQSDSLKEELTAFEKFFADAALDLGADSGGTEGSRTFSLAVPQLVHGQAHPAKIWSGFPSHTRAPQAARAAVLPV